jgi:hypothetical protein
MSVFDLTPEDERRHAAGGEELWGESWYLDWAAADATSGGYVRLGLYPNLGISWWWIALVGDGTPTVLVLDHELPCPEGPEALEVARQGTSVSVAVVDAMRSMRVRSKASGVLVTDPSSVFRGLEGPPVDVELDLTWTSRAEPYPYAMTTRYEISSWVTGSVRIADDEWSVDCAGQRDHSWGVRDWWLFPWNWTSGHLSDGTFFHGARSIIPDLELFAAGYVVAPGGGLVEADTVVNTVTLDSDQLPVSAEQRIGSVAFHAEPVGHAPLLLVAPDGRESRFPRAMCRYTTDDGRSGTGWTEYNFPS